MNRLYLCGPIATFGTLEANLAAFHTAATELRDRGYLIENPADNTINRPDDPDAWQQYMRLAVTQLVRCDGVAVLDGWQRSRGAALEVYLATQLGATVSPVSDWLKASPVKRAAAS